MKPDYGIDAPGVRKAMLAAGVGGMTLASLAVVIAQRSSGVTSTVANVFAAAAGIAGLYGLGMGAYMTYGSRVGKLRARDRLLDLAQAFSPWTGREAVLDVGCGRGLMLIGAARRLTTGKAVGIDLWRAEDQTANTPEATARNARIEGVADRVRIEPAMLATFPSKRIFSMSSCRTGSFTTSPMQ